MCRHNHIRRKTSLWCPKCRKWVNEFNVALNDSICTSCDELNLDDLYKKGVTEKLVELIDIRNGNIVRTYRTNYSKENTKMFDFDRMDKIFEKMGETFNDLDKIFKVGKDVKIFVNGSNVTDAIKNKFNNIMKEKINKEKIDKIKDNKNNEVNQQKNINLSNIRDFVKKSIFRLFDDTSSCMSFDPEDGLKFMKAFNENTEFLIMLSKLSKEDAYREIVMKFNLFNVFQKNLVKVFKIQTPYEFVISYEVGGILKLPNFNYRFTLKDNPAYSFTVDLIKDKLALNKELELLCFKENYNSKWETIQKKLNKLFFDSFITVDKSEPEKK